MMVLLLLAGGLVQTAGILLMTPIMRSVARSLTPVTSSPGGRSTSLLVVVMVALDARVKGWGSLEGVCSMRKGRDLLQKTSNRSNFDLKLKLCGRRVW